MNRPTLRVVFVVAVVASMVVAMMGTAAAQGHEPDPGEDYDVLVFHRTTGFRHDSIPAAIAAVEELGDEHGFSVTETQDPAVFDDETLRDYAAVVFFTDGENTLDHAQRTAFERYIHRGGGFVGLHSTTNMDTQDWPWWEDLLGGAFFQSHPPTQDATLTVEDGDHPSTAHLGDRWEWTDDEWYDFTANPRDGGAHILLTVDEATYDGGQMGDDHPIAWCNEFDGGRTFYTALGHHASHYEDPAFRQHVLGGLEWASGVQDGDCGEPREGPPTEAAFEKVALDDNTENPMRLDVLPDGRVIYVELAGTVKVYDPESQAVLEAAEIDVYRDQENGLLGVALDPSFEDNHHVYFFYSDPDEEQQHVSRFTFDDETNTIDLGSEVVLLEIPHQRAECCHSSGDIKFGPDGSLYISTGDDTNPFGSQNYAPIDYRDGRAAWDAARSSGNTADLRGKILRIVPMDDPGDTPGRGSTYTVPDDNLFTEANETWHHLFPDETFDPELAYPEIYVMGLRNPFGIAVDQRTGHLWVGDVGPDANPSGGMDDQRGPRGYDSWTQVQEATNLGWPFCYITQEPYRQWDFATSTAGDWYDCENGAVNDSPRNTGLQQLPPATERTIWYPYCPFTAEVAFPEIPSGNVTGGQNYGCGRSAFMGDIYYHAGDEAQEGAFPEVYDGKPFVMEWERDIIATLDLDAAGEYVEGSFDEFGRRWRFSDDTRFRKPHDLRFGPDGSMYLIEWGDDFNFAGGGANADSGLYRISYVKGGRTPVARAAATPDTGQPPLEVQFSSEGSNDPDGEEITYHWSFGDGNTSTDPNPTHTYTEAGVYAAQLTVTDTTDASSSSTVTITVGNTRPEVTIELPHHGQVFEWGDEIPYQVTVVDAEEGSTTDGDIDCAQVTVQRSLWHSSGEASHVHPGPSQTGCEGTFVTQNDADHGDDADIATVLTASYTDDGGDLEEPLTGGTTHLLQPQRKQAHHTRDAAPDLARAPSGDTQCCGDAIGGSDGAWASYGPLHLGGVEQMTLRAASLDDTTIEIRRDAPDGALLGTAEVEATAEAGRTSGPDGFGNAVPLSPDGPNEYVTLPEGIVSDVDDFTISAWVDWSGDQTWARIFDFGSGTDTYMFLSPDAGGDAGLRYAITTAGNGAGEQVVDSSQELPTDGWQHVAVTQSGSTATLYLNGEAIGTNSDMALSPSDLGVTEQNWIGESQWAADPLLDGAVDDFQIYGRALSASEVRSLMDGPGGDPGGGDVGWYRFDEEGGSRAVDSSGQDNHGTVAVSSGAATYRNVVVDLEPTSETLELFLVFPDAEARVNWMEFAAVEDEDPGGGDPGNLPPCEPVAAEDLDEFDGDRLDTDRWDVVEPDEDNLEVSDGRLTIQTVAGHDFFADGGTLPNVVVQDLPDGAWTATTRMEWAPAQNWQNAGIVVYADEGHYLKAGLVHADGHAFEFIKEVGDTPEFLGTETVAADFPDEFELRLVHDGSQVTAQFSTDGASWTTIGTTTLDGLDEPGVGLYATNSTGGDATEPPAAHVDWFRLEYEQPGEADTVTDHFDDEELDGCRWDRTVRYDPDTLDVSDGQLHVQTSPADIFGGDNTDPSNLVLQDLPDGDWTIETRMTARLERQYQNAGLLVYGDDDNYLKAGLVALNEPGEARELAFEMATEVDGDVQFPIVNESVPDSSIDEWYLRLTKEGDDYLLSWSLDGEDFTPLGESRSLELDDPAVGLYAVGTGLQEEPVTISWDHLTLLGELEPPTVEITVDPAEPDGDEGWYVSPVTIALSSDDDAELAWRLAGDDDWTTWTEPVTFEGDGTHVLEARASAPSGTSEVATVEFSVDRTAPETAVSVEGARDGDAYVGAATVTLEAEDATSGVAAQQVRLDGGTETAYEGPIVLDEPGDHTLEFRAIDQAGNVEAWRSVTVRVIADAVECSGTVVIEGVDSGVDERAVDAERCIADRIGSRSDHRNHGQFLKHVRTVSDELVTAGTIERGEASALRNAAARSKGGRPR